MACVGNQCDIISGCGHTDLQLAWRDSGAQLPQHRHVRSCRASARQPDGADGESPADPLGSASIDIEWRQRRWGDLWKSLADQDRSWAVHSYTDTDDHSNFGSSASNDSWDSGASTGCSPPTSLAHAPWPTTFGSLPGHLSLPLNQRMVRYHFYIYYRMSGLYGIGLRHDLAML